MRNPSGLAVGIVSAMAKPIQRRGARARSASRGAHSARPIRNLGPKSTVWLEEIGVGSLEDLHAIGALEAYRRVKSARAGVSIVLLYALQGAVFDCHWNDLPPGMKEELQAAAREL